MKRSNARRGLAALCAGALLTGAALAIGQGDSLISLSYLNKTYIPTIVAQGAALQDEKLTDAYETALNQLGSGGGSQTGSSGLNSPDFRERSYARGDEISLPTGSGFLLTAGRASIQHSGAVIDVTLGQTVPSGAELTAGHRYLVGEDTSAQVTMLSGLLRCGIQGGYAEDKGGEKAAPFTDVSVGDWYLQAVDYAYFNELFSGMGQDQFSPMSQMDRAMMMTVLYHLAGSPEEERLSAKATFRDVPADKWFYTFIAWAAERDVSAGMGDGMFAPYQPVKRQEVVVLLYNFASKYMGIDLPERADLSGCADLGELAFWSQDAMSWAVGSGVVAVSSEGRLEPQRSASRAEVASMLMNFSLRYLG